MFFCAGLLFLYIRLKVSVQIGCLGFFNLE